MARDLPRFFRGDAQRLTQILSHLISNALEHSGSKRVLVKVEVAHSDQAAVRMKFTVKDFGTGLCPDELKRLRHLLTCKSEQTADAPAGFGLSICQHLVALMNGDIHIDSELGQGSSVRFTVELDRKSTRLNSSHVAISYAVFCLKKKKETYTLRKLNQEQ